VTDTIEISEDWCNTDIEVPPRKISGSLSNLQVADQSVVLYS